MINKGGKMFIVLLLRSFLDFEGVPSRAWLREGPSQGVLIASTYLSEWGLGPCPIGVGTGHPLANIILHRESGSR